MEETTPIENIIKGRIPQKLVDILRNWDDDLEDKYEGNVLPKKSLESLSSFEDDM